MRRVLVGMVASIALLAACTIDHALVPCGERLCPIGTACTPGGCVDPERAAACATTDDGASCATTDIAVGLCNLGACYPSTCSDMLVDAAQGETCDDGNQLNADGCSADCKSREICGNGIIDSALGEQCDTGAIGLSHDGCTSTCTLEIDLWLDATPAQPAPRDGVQAAFDTHRAVTVIFGGRSVLPHADTFEWDGTNLRRRVSARTPPARSNHMMTYDPDRRRVVMFGGMGEVGLLADTWEWDGVNWVERTPATSPSLRSGGSMTYDESRNKTVLYGGFSALLLDTWEWDGTTWTQVPTTNSPGNAAKIAYDPSSLEVIAYGGGIANETWSYDGARWTKAGTAGPAVSSLALVTNLVDVFMVAGGSVFRWTAGAWQTLETGGVSRTDSAVAYDSIRDQIVMFAGRSQFGSERDLYEWKGVWTQQPLKAPEGRTGHAMAYDAARGRVVMFGGIWEVAPADDTWEWDGINWLLQSPQTRPDPSVGHAMAYDEKRGVIVMFGGLDSEGSPSANTWLYDGVTWTLASPTTSPPARLEGAMAYDRARGVVILFGGQDSIGSPALPFLDTWEWNGTNWSQRTSGPNDRTSHALVYDAARERIVLFGGFNEIGIIAQLFADTWLWDGTSWSKVEPAASPLGRRSHAMAYDPFRQRIVMFSGGLEFALQDTWEWNGTTWSMASPPVSPPQRFEGEASYHAIARSLVLFGGTDDNFAPQGETWTRRLFSTVDPAERCLAAAEDSDGDGLAGCADPDCFGRCAPLCLPGTPCDPTSPRCGDGACGAVEDYVICPGDCSAP